MRTASEGNDKFTSGVDAIRTILVDGFANISNEVGSSKIGNPNSLALSGQTNEARAASRVVVQLELDHRLLG